jgi:hypothetical protein
VALIIGALLYLLRYRPPLRSLLSFACVAAVLSECIKTFSVIKMVPSTDGSELYPYAELQHLPFHLCSLQIFFLFYARFAKDSPARTALLGFMYPSCTLGALFALAIPSILGGTVPVNEAFTHPVAYQYFLYHAMLVVVGLYILLSRQVDLRPRHYLTTLGTLGVVAFASLYLNSMFASPHYVDDKLISVDYVPNFFFTNQPPISAIKLTELWHWYLYLAVIAALALVLIALFYVPVFLRARKAKGQPTGAHRA